MTDLSWPVTETDHLSADYLLACRHRPGQELGWNGSYLDGEGLYRGLIKRAYSSRDARNRRIKWNENKRGYK